MFPEVNIITEGVTDYKTEVSLLAINQVVFDVYVDVPIALVQFGCFVMPCFWNGPAV